MAGENADLTESRDGDPDSKPRCAALVHHSWRQRLRRGLPPYTRCQHTAQENGYCWHHRRQAPRPDLGEDEGPNEYDVIVEYSEVCVTVRAASWREAEEKVRQALGIIDPTDVSWEAIPGREPAVVGVHTDDRDPHVFQPLTANIGEYPYRAVVCAECGWEEAEHRRRFEAEAAPA